MWQGLRQWIAGVAAAVASPYQTVVRLVRRRLSLSNTVPSSSSQAAGERQACLSIHASGFRSMPPEIMEFVFLHFRRGDLQTLASGAAAAHALHRICHPLLHRVMACRQCDAPLVHPRDVFHSPGACRAPPRLVFEDGPAIIVPMPRDLPRQGSSLQVVDPASDSTWHDTVPVHRFSEVVQHLQRRDSESASPVLRLRRLTCGRCHLYLGDHATDESHGTADGLPKGFAFICRSYIRCLDADGPCCEVPLPLRCSGARRLRGRGPCGQVLSDRSAVLSKRHCWSPPGGRTESAWYINGFVTESVVVGPARVMHLAQGLMEVADVSCAACLGVVGWKFVKDRDVGERNRNQVGRFGLCISSIAQDPESDEESERMLLESSSGAEEDEDHQEDDATSLANASASGDSQHESESEYVMATE